VLRTAATVRDLYLETAVGDSGYRTGGEVCGQQCGSLANSWGRHMFGQCVCSV